MERRLEARICTDTQRKPDLHHENKNEPQVYLLYSTQAYFIVFSFSLALHNSSNYNSEVEKELGLLFPSRISNQKKQSRPKTKFDMLVEDIRDGVLVKYFQ